MAIKSSGPISIQDIVNEFGGTGAAGLSEYARGGALVPNTNANQNIGTAGEPIALSQFYGARKEIILSYTLYGGAGAGGNGMANGNGGGSGASGGKTYISTKAAFDAAYPGPPADSNCLAVALGGAGGGHGNNGTTTGTTGEASDFGAGGAGGGPNSAGGRPAWGVWAAGGGGAGGDNGSGSYFGYGGDDPGAAGSAGKKGEVVTGDISVDVDVDYIVRVGNGAGQSSYASYRGGRGAPGYATFTLVTDNNTYTANSTLDGSDAAHWEAEELFNLKIARDGQVLFYPISQPAPLLQPQGINDTWSTANPQNVGVFGSWTYGFKLKENGTTERISTNAGFNDFIQFPTSITDWLTSTGQGPGAGLNYEVMVGASNGATTILKANGVVVAQRNQWISLVSDVEVYIAGTGEDRQTAQFDLSFRVAGEAAVKAQVITISVDTVTLGGDN